MIQVKISVQIKKKYSLATSNMRFYKFQVHVVVLFNALLVEHSVVIVSSDVGIVALVVEAAAALLSPFQW
jgi:hypothetical protein